MSPADLAAFDERWGMAPEARASEVAWVRTTFTTEPPDPWGIGGELMGAMARMYDLTHKSDPYLDHLRDLAEVVLEFRDDRRIDQVSEDVFRGRVMPGWGERGVNQGNLHWAGLVIAGVYTYPIAAFTRIVCENPDLHAGYGDKALEFVTATLETLRAYVDELRIRPDGIATFVQPRRCATLLSPEICEQAFREAKPGCEGSEDYEGCIDRLDRMQNNCKNLQHWARYPVPHNHAHAMVMAMIEAFRAVDSPFHRERAPRDELANWARWSLPLSIKQTHAWFRPRPVSDRRGRWLVWNYADGLPSTIRTRVEDTSHGGFSMRYIGLLARSIERVNIALFDMGQEPFDVSRMRRLLANTFLFQVGARADLAHRVDGYVNPKLEKDRYNATCNGWLDLAQVDDRVYYTCRDIVLRVVEDEQPYLNVGSHASLLANKPALTRLLVTRSAEFGTPAASGAPCVWLVPASGVDNIGYRDTSGRLHELWRDAAGTGTTNLTAAAEAPKAAGNPFGYVDTVTGTQILLYRTADGGIHSLYWSTGEVGHDDLTGSAGAPKAAGDPVGWFRPSDEVHHVLYRTGDGHLHVLWWKGPDPAQHLDLTAAASALPAAGDPSAYADPVRGDNIVFYRSTDGHVRSIYWLYGDIGQDDLSGVAGTRRAAGEPVAYYTPHDDVHQIVYRDSDGGLHELYAQGTSPVTGWPLTPPTGAPPADDDPAAFYNAGTHTKHVVYRSADGRLHDLWWTPGGGTPARVDLSDLAAAPTAADRPTALTIQASSIRQAAYRGADGHIYELRW